MPTRWRCSPAATIGNAAELLDIHVDQLARVLTFVANRGGLRCADHLAGQRIALAQTRHIMAAPGMGRSGCSAVPKALWPHPQVEAHQAIECQRQQCRRESATDFSGPTAVAYLPRYERSAYGNPLSWQSLDSLYS